MHWVPAEARRGCRMPWSWSYKVVVSCLLWVLGAVLGSFIGAAYIEPCLHLLLMEWAMERKTRCLPGLPFPKQVFEQGRISKAHPVLSTLGSHICPSRHKGMIYLDQPCFGLVCDFIHFGPWPSNPGPSSVWVGLAWTTFLCRRIGQELHLLTASCFPGAENMPINES